MSHGFHGENWGTREIFCNLQVTRSISLDMETLSTYAANGKSRLEGRLTDKISECTYTLGGLCFRVPLKEERKSEVWSICVLYIYQ